MRLLFITTLLLTACTPAAPNTSPTAKPVVVATVPPTPQVDYVSLRNELVQQLGPLIVAMRANDQATLPGFSAAFEQVAQKIEPIIALDVSPNANRLHSAIVNTRDAIGRKDVAEAERMRLLLLEIK